MNQEIDKIKAREKFIREYPNHISLRLSNTDRLALERKERVRRKRQNKLKLKGRKIIK
jgi:hypothetical protein